MARDEPSATDASLVLPNGDTIEPGDVILFEGYPYRYVTGTNPTDGFTLAPIYWGESTLDLHFESSAELIERWGAESRGALTEDEWEAWLTEARGSATFTDAELDAVAGAVLSRPQVGILDRLRGLLG